MSITAEQDPVSIFGGFGGLGDAGLEEVDQRYQLAAGAFLPSGARVDFDYLVKDVRGRLAYTVAIERSNVIYAGHTEPQPQVLRVTMIFRFDHGGWSIVHRHADTMIDLQLPDSLTERSALFTPSAASRPRCRREPPRHRPSRQSPQPR